MGEKVPKTFGLRAIFEFLSVHCGFGGGFPTARCHNAWKRETGFCKTLRTIECCEENRRMLCSIVCSYTSRTALMQPSMSGLFVTWAYLAHTTLPP
eukprot:1374094-Amphidinium_carterae.1